MASALKVDAKDPNQARDFVADSGPKQKSASGYVRAVVAEHGTEAYARLEEERKRRETARRPSL
jgi:hypothetical protein